MKSIIKYISLVLLASFAAVACDLRLEPGMKTELSVNLQLVCADPQVKATEAGVDTYNENTISYVDYFVYAEETGTTCLKHARVNPTNGSVNIVLTELVGADKPLAENDPCYIYVVANWPNTLGDNLSVASLRRLSVTANDLDVAVTTNKHKFVMDTKGELVSATVSRTGASVTANLHRLEAKLTMEVNIPASIVSDEVTYTPEPNSLRIYYLYATNSGVLDGSPMSYSTATDPCYFDYPFNRSVTVTGNTTDGYVGTAAPFYTYPEQWTSHEISAPYFKVVLSWRSSTGQQTAKPYYYKILLPESMGGKIDRNTIYKFIMNIGVLGSETDDGAVEIEGNYYVVDWQSGAHLGEDGAISRGKYLEIARETYYIYGGNSIEIPVTSSHDLEITVNSATYTNFSSTNPAPANLASSAYSVSEDGRYSFTLTHNLVTNVTSANLDCSPFTFDLTVSNGVSPSKHVTVIQYPPVYISSEASNRYVFINGASNRTNLNDFTEVFDDGVVGGSFTYSPNIKNSTSSYTDIEQGDATISFSNTSGSGNGKTMGSRFGLGILGIYYDGTITVSAPNGGAVTKITLSYYDNQNVQDVSYDPSAPNSSKTEWVGSAQQVVITMECNNRDQYNNRNIVSSIRVEYSSAPSSQQSLGSIRGNNVSLTNNNNPNIYTISVSSLAGTNWSIADPRSDVGVSYPSLRGGSPTGTPLMDYLDVASGYDNAVAPQFKIASSYGANESDTRVTFEGARKRCASYQENGYPAGRWRVPTDAEIRFMVYLSAVSQKIPSLFNGHYWSASGTILNVSGSSVSTVTDNVASVRCVYDSWYWGSTPMSAYSETWSGWQTNI